MRLTQIAEFSTGVLNNTLPTTPIELETDEALDLAHDTMQFLFEEMDELRTAMRNHDIIEIADALGDIIYFAAHQALKYGIPIDDVVSEIHRSNMSKTAGKKDGRSVACVDAVKTESYRAPALQAVLWPEEEPRSRNSRR